jgi:hypothetical protein
MAENPYTGKISNGSTQVIKAPNVKNDGAKGKVKKGGDLRAK